MEFENESVNVEEVATPQIEPQEVENVDTGESETNEALVSEEVAAPQSSQVNAQFAAERRKQELEEIRQKHLVTNEENARLKAELERVKAQAQTALSPFVEGNDLDSMLLHQEAQEKGITVAELQDIKVQEQALLQRQALVNSELEHYRNMEAQRLFETDLKAVQALDPNIKNLDELGEDFVKLRFTQNPLTGQQFTVNEVYNHLKSKIKPVPPTSGALNAQTEGKKEKDYSKMSDADFEKHYNSLVFGG